VFGLLLAVVGYNNVLAYQFFLVEDTNVINQLINFGLWHTSLNKEFEPLFKIEGMVHPFEIFALNIFHQIKNDT